MLFDVCFVCISANPYSILRDYSSVYNQSLGSPINLGMQNTLNPVYIITVTFYSWGQSCHLEGPRQAGGTGQEKPYDIQQGQMQSPPPGRKNPWNDIGSGLTGWRNFSTKSNWTSTILLLSFCPWNGLCFKKNSNNSKFCIGKSLLIFVK